MMAQQLCPLLEITPRTICFAAEPRAWVDVNVFRELMSASSSTLSLDPESEANADRIQQAVALYRGDMLRATSIFLALPLMSG